MPRTESRTKTAIWTDPEFLARSEAAQRLYWLLYSQPTINLCGILALTVGRWAAKASDSTVEGIRAALAELEAAGFVVVDSHTEELWVRSFVRHDGVGNSPKTRQAAWGQLQSIFSDNLRELAEGALREMDRPDEPDKAPIPYPENGNRVCDTLSDGVSDGVSHTLRVRARADSSLQSPSPTENGGDGDGVLRTETGGLTLTGYAKRLSEACRPNSIEAAQFEASHVVAWALRYVDPKLLEEAIGWAESKAATTDPVRLPRGVAKTLRDKAADRNIPMPAFDPSKPFEVLQGRSA